MSDSSYKLTTSSRRQPVNRRQRPRPVKKVRVKTSKATTTKQSQRQHPSNNSVITTTAVPVQRTRVVKPGNTNNGQIPPYNPNAVKVKSVRVRKQPLPRKNGGGRKTRLKPMARNILYGLRLLIVGVGIGAIVGTALSVLDPASHVSTSESPVIGQSQQATQNTSNAASTLVLSQENLALKSAITNLTTTTPNFTTGVFLVDLDTNSFVDINGARTFSSASTIKLPILIALFQEVDAGKIRLEDSIATKQELLAGGSGDIQQAPIGTKYTILDLATKMITISDNTATNMLIERLGGIENLNQRFRGWGLASTSLRNLLPDLKGTNTTSPKDLAGLIAMITKGNIVTNQSRDRILDIMRRTVKDTLLPSGIDQGATIAHKTGDIASMVADVGLIESATGKRYIAGVMVERPNNDNRAETLISSISRLTFQQLTQPNTVPNNPGRIPPINNIPPTIQPSNINPPLPTGSNIPGYSYQSPRINSLPNYPSSITPYPNSVGGATMPNNGYQPGYQQPVTAPQYYYPYQR
ncbi:serine hydrolase [Calothrix sp. PCC 6303]|uniref:serine hydrolase n=1 Tax=Calothrix sp. PCC 6303 TaxID=1170562 RepID=UPI0002A02DBE|nr:serine hydrolase [Calothrix sp. PCC 6303]AFZ02590.1 beta-lactamase [Calothrix sp. PCC 6303]